MQRRTLSLSLAIAACTPSAPPLAAPFVPDMRSMVVAVEHTEGTRLYAHATDGRDGLSVDSERAARMTALFYKEGLEVFDLREGEQRLVPVGRSIPAEDRAFVLDLKSDPMTWIPVEARPSAIDALVIAERTPDCAEFDDFEVVLTEDSTEIPPVVLSDRRGGVLAVTAGRLYRYDGDTVTALHEFSEPVSPGAGYLEPDAHTLWLSRSNSVVRIELETGVVTTVPADLGGFVIRMAGRESGDFEIFTVDQERKVRRFDGTNVTELGTIPTRRGLDVTIAWEREKRAWIANRTASVWAVTPAGVGEPRVPRAGGACSSLEGIGYPDTSISMITRWNDGLIAARGCASIDTKQLMTVDEDGLFAPLPSNGIFGEPILSAAPLGDGMLLGGEDGAYAEMLADGTLCPRHDFDDLSVEPAERPYHFTTAVALDSRTVVLAGSPVTEDLSRKARFVVVRKR